MEWAAVEESLNKAKADFLQSDRYLLEIVANERSMTHKFAEHLQRYFAGWNVDCEYNRNGAVPKRLLWLLEEKISSADEDARTVFPDIIVHRRGTDSNLLVLEAKKSGGKHTADRQKLEAFMSADEFHYRYGVLLCFVTGGDADVTIEPL